MHTHRLTRSYAHYLHKLMPVLYWFARIGQHGSPVLPPRTFSFAPYTTHPYNLVMTDADAQQGQEEWKRGWERQREREKQAVRKGNGWREGLEKQKEGDRACKKQPQSLIYQPWVLGKEYSGWGRKLNSTQIHTALYKTSVSEEAGMSTNIQKHTPIEMPNGGQAT